MITRILNIQAHQGGRQAKQGRVFMKGSLKGGLYLTLAYASDKTQMIIPCIAMKTLPAIITR